MISPASEASTPVATGIPLAELDRGRWWRRVAARPFAVRGAFGLKAVLPTGGLGIVLAYLTLFPIGLLVYSSFKPTGLPLDPGFTLGNYTAVYGDTATYTLLLTSLEFAVGSTILALVIATTLAYLVERTDMLAARAIKMLTIVPLAIPPVLFAIAWALLAGPQIGLINGILREIVGGTTGPLNVYSLPGMIIVQAMAVVPTAFLIVGPALRNLSPSMEEAALASGARPRVMLFRVILPALGPALLASATFLFIIALLVFDVPGVLGLPGGIFVLSSAIYNDAAPSYGTPEYGQISALAVGFLLILLVLSAVYHRQTRQAQRYATVSGRGWHKARFELGRWRRVAGVLCLLYVAVSFVAPIITLIWMSLVPYYSGFSSSLFSRLTFSSYSAIFHNQTVRSAAENSLLLMVVTATAVTLLSALTSWVSVRSRAVGRRIIDNLAFLPLAIPSMMVGLTLIFVYLTVHFIPVYGTIWIIAIALITAYLAFGTRITNIALMQIDPELEEAAAASGAGWGRKFRTVTLPLMGPALFAVWIWVAARAVSELSAALILQGTSNGVMATVIWTDWANGQATQTAALGVCLVVAILILVLLWDRAANRNTLRDRSGAPDA
jgi:iron(III) transport system permease protein